MSSWQKLIRSGSDALLNRLYVSTSITSSLGFSGSLSGTASQAVSSSYAVSASWAPGGSSVSASYALTASYFNGGLAANFTQAAVDVTWSFTHNLNNETPLVTVWDNNKEIVIPEKIKSNGVNSTLIYFPVSMSGYASAVNGLIPNSSPLALSSSYSVTASYSSQVKSLGITIDGGGSVITTGVKGDITIPFNGTITAWYLVADQAGSIVIDVWKNVFASYPPTVANTIAGSEKPTLSSQSSNSDTNLTTWTTSVSVGDTIRFNVDSVSTVTRVNLMIKVVT